MQMGLLTFSDMDCFLIFYPLYLSVHGTLIQQISMVNNPPVENPWAITPVPGTVSGTTAAECKFRSLFLTDSYHNERQGILPEETESPWQKRQGILLRLPAASFFLCSFIHCGFSFPVISLIRQLYHGTEKAAFNQRFHFFRKRKKCKLPALLLQITNLKKTDAICFDIKSMFHK